MMKYSSQDYTRRESTWQAGFSLVEILVVVGIMILLFATVTPAFESIAGGNRLTSTASNIVSELNLARQAALSESKEIEVRFFKLAGQGGGAKEYRAFQRFNVADGTAAGSIMPIKNPLIIINDSKFSTLITEAPEGTMDLPNAPQTGYRAIRFRPSGTTNLDPQGARGGQDRWFLTLADANKFRSRADTQGLPADNFITIQVDPISGRPRTFQP